jgi:hypothetical protein
MPSRKLEPGSRKSSLIMSLRTMMYQLISVSQSWLNAAENSHSTSAKKNNARVCSPVDTTLELWFKI